MNPQQMPGQPVAPTSLDGITPPGYPQPPLSAIAPNTVIPPSLQSVDGLPTVTLPQMTPATPAAPVPAAPAPAALPQAPAPAAVNPFVAPQPRVPMQPTLLQAAATAMPAAPATAAAQPVVKGNPNSTQNTLQIAEIRDGIVIMSDGSFRSVIMLKSINFDLMSQQEQEAVEYSYQSFLNSLYFPIQIFVRSQRVDMRPYIEKLDKIRTEHDNMLLALLMEDYIVYIDQLASQANIMDKKFYLVIPYFPNENAKTAALDQSKNFLTGLAGLFNNKETHVTINEADLENAKNELRNRVQATLAGLLQSGVQGLPLDTQELIELYYDSYNPDTATRQQLKDFEQLTADVVTKGVGSAPQQHLQGGLQ